MAIPIPDLKVDEGGISCTLSFNRVAVLVPHPVDGGLCPRRRRRSRRRVAEDVPPEIQQQKPAAAAQGARPAKKARPKLTAVGARSRDQGDKHGRRRPRDRALSLPSPALAARPGQPAASPSSAGRPPPSDDGIVEAEPVRPVASPTSKPPAKRRPDRRPQGALPLSAVAKPRRPLCSGCADPRRPRPSRRAAPRRSRSVRSRLTCA